MLEATKKVYELLGFGNIVQFGETYTQTESGVWCHILSPKHILALQEKTGKTVQYFPFPCIYLHSREKTASPEFCLMLHGKNESISEEVLSLCQYFFDKDIIVNRVDDADFSPRERLRSFKEASFVLAVHCEPVFSQICLCTSGTPFLLLDTPTVIARDFIELANVKEAITETPNIKIVKELYDNKTQFRDLVNETVTRINRLRHWKSSGFTHRASGVNKNYLFTFDKDMPHLTSCINQAGILFSFDLRKTFLTPWVGYITAENIVCLNQKAFQVSILTCLGFVAENKSVLQQIRNAIDPIPATALLFPEMKFQLKIWKEHGKPAYVNCSDGKSFTTSLQTLVSSQIKKISFKEGDIIICDYPLNWPTMKRLIKKSIPFVCPEADELPGFVAGYPGFQNCSYTPESISVLLTDKLVAEMVSYLSVVQYQLFYQQLQETAVYANCHAVSPQ